MPRTGRITSILYSWILVDSLRVDAALHLDQLSVCFALLIMASVLDPRLLDRLHGPRPSTVSSLLLEPVRRGTLD